MIEGVFDLLKDEGVLEKSDFLIIENVGNLVCSLSYNLGVVMNIVLFFVLEGDDKVLKYFMMFMCVDVVIISKVDMVEVFNFRVF